MTAVSAPVPLPLSMIQQHMLLSERLGRSQASHLLCLALRLDGVLHVEPLRRALTRIIERHEILRTGVCLADGMPAAEVRSAEDFQLALERHAAADLSSSGGLNAILGAEAKKSMDLLGGLPVRARLLQAPGTSVLIVTVHHLAFDEWSRRVFYEELSVLYNAFRHGLGDPLPPPAVTYFDIVALCERQLAAEGEQLLAYWQDRLVGLVPFELPSDHSRPARRAGLGAAVRCVIPQADVARLAVTARASGASLATVLFAACQALLCRSTGRDDVTVGTTWAGREEASAASVIGPLVNLVVLRTDASGDPAFADLVTRFSEVAVDAYDHSAAPFEQLVERLAGRRDPSRTPLFQILVEYVDGTQALPRFDGLVVSQLSVPCTTSKYDLGFWFEHTRDGSLTFEVVWDTSLYRSETTRAVADQLQQLLTYVAAYPRTRLSDIPMPTVSASPLSAGHPGAGDATQGLRTAPRVPPGAGGAPRTPVEEELAAIWADVLDRSAPGVDDDFFVLGGHSLLIMRVANRIRDRFDIDVPLSVLFEHTTIADLAIQMEHLAHAAG
jgi:acyl carrier protein